MELSPGIMKIFIDAARPGVEVTSHFEKACRWLTDDDDELYKLASDWYHRTLKYTTLLNVPLQDSLVLKGLGGLAEKYRIEQVQPYLDSGCTDLSLVARAIDEGIDYDLLTSLKGDEEGFVESL